MAPQGTTLTLLTLSAFIERYSLRLNLPMATHFIKAVGRVASDRIYYHDLRRKALIPGLGQLGERTCCC